MDNKPIPVYERNRDIEVITKKDLLNDRLVVDSLVHNALERDHKDDFVRLINNCTSKEEIEVSYSLSLMYRYDSVNCAAAVLAGETAGLFDITDSWSPPLHEAASHLSPRLTALLLHNGNFTANARSNCDIFKNVLPLEVALGRLKYKVNLLVRNGQYSATSLLTKLCQSYRSDYLETVRLLAKNTKQLNQLFLKYLNDGNMVEVAALLLVSRDQLLSFTRTDFKFKNIVDMQSYLLTKYFCNDNDLGSFSAATNLTQIQYEEEQMHNAEMLQLLKIIDSIGDKLAAYLRLEEQFRGDESLEVASLLEDAGFPVKSEDIYSGSGFYRSTSWPFNENVMHVGLVDGSEQRTDPEDLPIYMRKMTFYGGWSKVVSGLGCRQSSTICSMRDADSASYPTSVAAVAAGAVVPSFPIHKRCTSKVSSGLGCRQFSTMSSMKNPDSASYPTALAAAGAVVPSFPIHKRCALIVVPFLKRRVKAL